ncbi:MAG: hypothetical protein ACHQ1H_10685, partial [Nitrososphaerales archaeon]
TSLIDFLDKSTCFGKRVAVIHQNVRSFANLDAIAAPIPLDAPVTIADFPTSFPPVPVLFSLKISL